MVGMETGKSVSGSLALLRVAETSWIPLAFLCAFTTVVILLRQWNVSTPVTPYIPGWLPILILIVIAVGQTYLSTIPRFRRNVLWKEWRGEVADHKCSLELTESGFDYTSINATYKPCWSEVASVFQTKQLLMLPTTMNMCY